MRFPNKMITETHEKAKGKTFTWSPTNQRFNDDIGCSEYNYSAMIWLKENGQLVLLPVDHKSFVHRFKLKD